MKTLTRANVETMIYRQARNADFWIAQWEQHKDVSGIRNASMAIGKIFGLYSALSFFVEAGNEVTDIDKLMSRYDIIWNELKLSQSGVDCAKHDLAS